MFGPKITKSDTKTARSPDSEPFFPHAPKLTGKSGAEQEVGLAARPAARCGTPDFSTLVVFPPRRIQPKLVVGEVNDPLEHEAETVAHQVTHMPDWPAAPSRMTPVAQRGDVPGLMPAAQGSWANLSSGQPLDAPTRAYFEPRFGHDFSRVRVHTDGQAAQAAASLGALAYTSGSHIVFAAGRYQPHMTEGRSLIAHELGHTIQQTSSPARAVRSIQRAPAGKSSELARVRKALEEAQGVATDLIEETTGTVVNTGRPGRFGRQPRANRRRTQRILAELDEIANDESVPKQARDNAAGLSREIQDLDNAARAQEIERARAAGAPKAAERRARQWKEWEARQAEKSGAAKVEGAAAKAEDEIVKAEGAAAKFARLGSKAGRLAVFLTDLALPGPLDVLFLWIGFFGSLAEAKAKLREEWFAVGFSEGMAASLLGFSAGEATHMLIKPVTSRGGVGEQVAGFGRVRERATNEGAVSGWDFAGRLGAQQRAGFLKAGFAAIKGKNHGLGPNFNLDDVIELGVAIKPIVDELLEVARQQEEAAREEEEAKRYLKFQEASLRFGPKD